MRSQPAVVRNQPIQLAMYTGTASTTIDTKAGMPSRSSAHHDRARAPARRRAETSQKTVSRPIAARA